MSDIETVADGDAVFHRDGDTIVPSTLARGPWCDDAQHGGAPAALCGALAEATLPDADWHLARLTLELMRPVPIAPLSVAVEPEGGRSVRRATVTIAHDGVPVARAVALAVRTRALDVAPAAPERVLPPPADCGEAVRIRGMPEKRSFAFTAMETRLAGGRVDAPGPAAAWYRLRVPVLAGQANTSAVRALAAADFGNGISWAVPIADYLFANPDLSVYLERAAVGEWIGIDSETRVSAAGMGLASSVLYDEAGRIGMAHQQLLVRPR